MAPSVVFGMTLYNNARHLPQTIESILAQSDGDFGLVLLDDASADATETVARRYVERDHRVRYVRHASRRGMVPTWHEAFDIARREFPSARYFAWASDHDWWHPDWLARVRATLERQPDAVMAYALTQRVDDSLVALDKPPKAFDTTSMPRPAARVLAFAAEPAGAGDMVYGLMRADALERAGVFRPVIQPDRLLMVEMAIAGTFAQVPEVLWLRRQPATASVTKQLKTLFVDGEAPAGLWLPAWIQHSRVLLREYVAGRRAPQLSRGAAAWLVVRYQLVYLYRHYNKRGYALHRLDNAWEQLLQWRKELKSAYRHAVYWVLVNLRPKHVAKIAQKYWLHVWNRALYRAAVVRRRTRAAVYEMTVAAQKRLARVRRAARKATYEVLMLTRRLGLRGRH
jgi:glycosyltransferase involved in cell wall biosynthesis